MTDDRILAFRDALRSGDSASAVDSFDGFDDAVDDQANRESALRDVARGVVARTPPDDPAHQAAQQFLQAVNQAQQARVKAKYDFALHLEGGPDADDVADRVDAVVDTTDAVDSAAGDLQDEAGDVDLPPSLAVTGPSALLVPKGTAIDAEYTAENLGVTEATDLAVTVEGYDVAVDPAAIDALLAGEATTLAVTGDADEAVEAPLIVTVGSETARTDLRVVDKAGFLDRALTVLDEVEERLDRVDDDDGGNGKGGKGNGKSGIQGLHNKVDTARKRIEKLIDRLESGGKGKGGKSVDNRIRSTMQLLGAFINQAEGLSGNQLSAQDAAVLAGDAGEVIDELDAATRAEA
ncbi:hypothetical protein BRC81_01665 [Halobacteriales archaeon QS_1_68_20]|nr:MAG: hypothetical protein BRC81_01665 [Halobacteriales archaeon QS_1_68_20]